MSPRRFGRAADSPPEPETPAEEPQAGPGDLSAAAEQCRLDAEKRAADASQLRSDAQSAVATAEQDAARIVAQAREKSLRLIAEATAADREASALEERSGRLTAAEAAQSRAAEADQLASGLADERTRLGAQVDNWAADLERLHGERRDADSQLATALENSDRRAVTAGRNDLATINELVTALTGKRDAALSRLALIGDGSTSFPGLLLDARNSAGGHHAEARRLLNLAWPNRPEAVLDAAIAELRATVSANAARIAEEAKTASQQPTVVRL